MKATCLKDGTVEYHDADVYQYAVMPVWEIWVAKLSDYTRIPIDDLWAKTYGFANDWPVINGWEYAYAEEE